VEFSNVMNSTLPCRAYIVYRHALFALGVRSVLEKESGVQIVGMEENIGRALKAVRSLQPEVVIVEEPTEKNAQWPFLKLAAAARVVTLSLDHAFATVYDQRRIPASDPAELIRAIQGGGRQHIPGPDQPHPKASMPFHPEPGRNRDEGRSGKKSRERRTRRQGTHVSDKPRRASRGSQKRG